MSNSNLNFSFLNSRAFGTEISNLTHDQTNVYQNVQEDIKTYVILLFYKNIISTNYFLLLRKKTILS